MVQRLAVGAVIANRKGEFLVVRRSPGEDFLPNLWELPGGGVDAGEGLLEATVREVEEETGLKVINFEAYVGSFDYFSSSGAKTREFNFLVTTNPGPVKLNFKEHSEFLWVKHNHTETFEKLGISHLEIVRNASIALEKLKRREL